MAREQIHCYSGWRRACGNWCVGGLGVGRRLAKRGGWRWKTTTHDTGDAAPVTTRMPHRLSTISGRVRATACVCFYNSSALLSTAQRGAVVLSEGVTCAGAFPLRRAPA
jgi:hypothetical protein